MNTINLSKYTFIFFSITSLFFLFSCGDDDLAPSCNDGIKNGVEVGVDCGGQCPPCFSCVDGILNGNETGIDCGGDCIPCPTCVDGIQNGNETGIDCGGGCPACSTSGCTDPNAHNYNPTADIDDGSCETCNDGILNGDETGIDCGGVLCSDCKKTFRATYTSFTASRSILETDDGYVMVGNSNSKAALMFIDADGVEQSIMEYDGRTIYTIETLINDDGFIFIAADASGDKTYIIRTNKFGNQIGSSIVIPNRTVINRILKGGNSNYLLFGQEVTPGSRETIIELNINGQIVNQYYYGTNSSFFDAVNFSGSSYAILGVAGITIVDSNGTQISKVNYPSSYNLRSLLVDEGNNQLIVSGFDAATSDWQRFIIKTGFNGDQIGSSIGFGVGTNDVGAYGSDGSIMVAGSDSFAGNSGGNVTLKLLHLNTEGDQISGELTYDNLGTPRGIVRTRDGGFAIVGFISNEQNRSYLMKLDENGQL